MKKKPQKAAKKKAQKTSQTVLIGVALVVAASVGTLFWWSSSSNNTTETFLGGDIVMEAATLGDPDAPVVFTEYTDFQCSACRYLVTNILPQLIEEYVNTGVVRLEYRHFAHYGEESLWAGMASECANEQHKFLEFHDLLFSVQRSVNSGTYSKAKLTSYAQRVGLNTDAFTQCLNSDRYLSKVKLDSKQARDLGGTGTPTIFINGRILGGVPPMALLRKLIQEALDT